MMLGASSLNCCVWGIQMTSRINLDNLTQTKPSLLGRPCLHLQAVMLLGTRVVCALSHCSSTDHAEDDQAKAHDYQFLSALRDWEDLTVRFPCGFSCAGVPADSSSAFGPAGPVFWT